MPTQEPDYFSLYELPTGNLSEEPCSRVGADLLSPETVAARYGINPSDFEGIAGIQAARCTVKFRGGPYYPYDLYNRGMLARWEVSSMADDLAKWEERQFFQWSKR